MHVVGSYMYVQLRVRNLGDKAVNVASGLANCGIQHQEALSTCVDD